MGRSRQASDRAWQAARKNLFINGCFRVWQRGGSQTASGYGSDDRYSNAYSGTTSTVNRQTFVLGQTDVPGEPQYYSRTAVTSSAAPGNFAIKIQAIEDARVTAGKTITFSFWAKADASKTIALEWFRSYGSGGSPSLNDNGSVLGWEHFNLTTSWQKFTVTYDVPSLSGKTLGTNEDHYFSPFLWMDAGTSYNSRTGSLGHQSGSFDFAQMQFEFGDEATEFEFRPFGTELMLCQRYFQKNYDLDQVPGDIIPGDGGIHFRVGNSTTDWWIPIYFHQMMRTQPSVTIYNGDTGASGTWRGSSSTNYTITANNVSEYGFAAYFSGGSALNYLRNGYWIADAEL